MPAEVTMSSTAVAAPPPLDAWVGFLRAHAALTRQLNADLLAQHGLTINDFEVLLHLSLEPERRLRRVDLAERLLLTPSGITRLLEGLERTGLVARAKCSSDARVSYAVLTEAGAAKLAEARHTHLAGVQTLFVDRFTPDELETLGDLLSRLPQTGASPCS